MGKKQPKVHYTDRMPQKRTRQKDKPLMMRGGRGWRWVPLTTHPSQSKEPHKEARIGYALALLFFLLGIIFGSQVAPLYFISWAFTLIFLIPANIMYKEGERRKAEQERKRAKSGSPGTARKKKRR